MKPAVLIVAAILAASPTAAADWVRVETQNFIVYGATDERRVREVASEFERFREVLARVLPGASRPAAVPTVVMVFGSSRSFDPYKPRFNGKPTRLNGCFFSSEDMNIVAMVDDDRDESLRTILHEYVHLVIANMMPNMPLWLNEGLAEYYSTFQVQADGRRALLGRVIPAHLDLLNQRKLLPIEEMLDVDQSSPAYNEEGRQTLFYAQSWAIVHMLMSGLDNRSSDVSAYLNLVASGTPSRDAWKKVFGEQNVLRQVGRYTMQGVVKGVLYRFDRDLPKVAADTSKVTAGDTEAALADLLRRVAPHEETTARFEKATAIEPRSARARALFGLHAIDQNDYARARALLVDAVDDRADWLVQYHVATGLTRLASEGANRDAELVGKARAALERVLAARPELPNAHALSARLDSMGPGNLARGLEAVRRARALAPGRSDYTLLESFIQMRLGAFTEAKGLLTPLLSAFHEADVRDRARGMLAQVAHLELEAAAYLARLEGRRPDPLPARPDSAKDVVLVPNYRTPSPGETRIEGNLERIDCLRDGVMLHVRVGTVVERFPSPDLTGIAFISYRTDLPGAITCAMRKPPDRVYLTWRADGSRRRVVAVEFLPN
ncbi:MAG TPA: DUF1570 domain-containing protein [Vicinamibacterales bacterium]|jgi:hypothetical protein